jgi:hypothetical protein
MITRKVIKLEIAFECPPDFNYDTDAPRLRDFAASAIAHSMHANPSLDLKPDSLEARVLMVVASDGMVERRRP